MPSQDKKALQWIKNYCRYTDYLGVAQLYLRENILLREPLQESHLKKRILGHWGTVPGLNFMYAHLNYLIYKHKCEVLFVTGPGHGAPAVLSNLFAEKTLGEFYPKYSRDEKGMRDIARDFSWPHSGFPSHVTPGVPGSILEGGELGYSLSTAFGAVMDNPNLIAAVAVGDGEAESGPLLAAWNSTKFLNPRTSGAVLPIVHINGYKISNPTLYGTMSNKELTDLYNGFGYKPHIVEGTNISEKMMKTLEKVYKEIRTIQTKARKTKKFNKPKWPVILLRSPKGMKGIHEFKGKQIEGSYRSHGIPLGKPQSDKSEFEAVKKWLESYKIHELVDSKGRPTKETLAFVPKGKKRMGMCQHAIGGNLLKKLKLPRGNKYEVKFKKRGHTCASRMKEAGKMFRDIIKQNPKNFRMFCPDEIESNKLSAVFETTKRAYTWPVKKTDVNIHPDGRVMEVLSEHTLQGWMQGYLLTGRYGVFVSYEAFTTIIASMVDQYAKFLKQSFKVKWRKPIAPAVYIQSSVGWRQDHNGYSHQNPSFVSSVLQKHGEFSQIYYPADANSMIAALEEVYKKKDGISVIVAGKRDLPVWQSLKEAREQAKSGVAVWDWVGGKKDSKNPDVVMASAGDYMTNEAIMGVKICKEVCPDIKIRFVNISELSGIAIGDYCNDFCKRNLTQKGFEDYFTKDKPVVINYHGYANDLEQILWEFECSDRIKIYGYSEEGSTTTPFDMMTLNKVSRYHVAMHLIEEASKKNKKIAKKKAALCKALHKKIKEHHDYICKHGDDPEELKKMMW